MKKVLISFIVLLTMSINTAKAWEDLHIEKPGFANVGYAHQVHYIRCNNGDKAKIYMRRSVMNYKYYPHCVKLTSQTSNKYCFEEFFEAAERACRMIGSN